MQVAQCVLCMPIVHVHCMGALCIMSLRLWAGRSQEGMRSLAARWARGQGHTHRIKQAQDGHHERCRYHTAASLTMDGHSQSSVECLLDAALLHSNKPTLSTPQCTARPKLTLKGTASPVSYASLTARLMGWPPHLNTFA
jgi:hypothetical protein